jgi:hypothetical protein
MYVLVCRMLLSLPSVYMDEPGSVHIINSSGVRKIDIGTSVRVEDNTINNEYWCLVDSNDELETVPKAIYSLGIFILQSASPRDKRIDWCIKYPCPLDFFFMKEWSLSELIIAYVFDHNLFVTTNTYIYLQPNHTVWGSAFRN